MLELKGIAAGYGRQTVLDGVTASLERGRLTSVVGANGCGKSTLLKVIAGILPPKAGEILVDGESLSSLPRNRIAQRVAYLPQGKNTPDMTVRQMVLHGRFPYLRYPRRYGEADKAVADAAMAQVGISHLAEKPLHALSGGMRQNAYIAMALAQDTEYILLDEPTTYLDIAHQLELMRILRGLADGGKGVLCVMHDLPLAFDFSDEILLMREGGLLCKGDPKRVAALPTVEEIFGVELRYSEAEGKFLYRYGGASR